MSRPRRARLDAELVRRGLARSRDQAAQLITDGQVRISGQVATKAATAVTPDTPVLVDAPAGPSYVSRGAHKLAGALDAFGLDPVGRRVLDAGASTGGFTDLLLQRGAAHVVAVDVGYGQLAWSLQTDPRVTVLDRTNVRTLTLGQVGEPVDLLVADLSFIPLGLVLPSLLACCAPAADAMPMVKPQFEVGREALPSGGVVRDPAQRVAAVRRVGERAAALGWGVTDVVASPLPGPSGNVEFFLRLRQGTSQVDLTEAVAKAVREGPA